MGFRISITLPTNGRRATLSRTSPVMPLGMSKAPPRGPEGRSLTPHYARLGSVARRARVESGFCPRGLVEWSISGSYPSSTPHPPPKPPKRIGSFPCLGTSKPPHLFTHAQSAVGTLKVPKPPREGSLWGNASTSRSSAISAFRVRGEDEEQPSVSLCDLGLKIHTLFLVRSVLLVGRLAILLTYCSR